MNDKFQKGMFAFALIGAVVFSYLSCVAADKNKTAPDVSETAEGQKKRVVYEFDIRTGENGEDVKLYVPYPVSEDSQDISGIDVSGNFSTYEVKKDEKTGASFLYAEWTEPAETPKMSFAFDVDSHFKKGPELKEGDNVIPDDIKPYLQASRFIPCDNEEIIDMAAEAAGSAETILEKARAVYEWTIANTFRDPSIVGCGLGRAMVTLNENNGGGKCADISSVFVTVLRAAGVPAREVYGLRTAAKDGEISGDFHCWVEFYLPGTGWVQADPADVRKAMLLEDLELDDPKTKEWTEFFWNGDNLFRIILSRADKGVAFDTLADEEALDYFMYPFALVDGEALDYFDYKSFAYKVSIN